MRFIPAILFAGLIFWMSSLSHLPSEPFLFCGIDKLFHAAEYGVLMLLVLFGDRWPRGRRAWLWLIPCALYAASDELHQLGVPGRNADFADLMADVSAAVLVVSVWQRRASRGSVKAAS